MVFCLCKDSVSFSNVLSFQIDAAINAGNSGGPAFNDRGQCVGIAFQSLKHEDAENIGYVIPTPVITHFITDYVRTGDYTGILISHISLAFQSELFHHAVISAPGNLHATGKHLDVKATGYWVCSAS